MRTLLAAGLPVDATGKHRPTPLGWAMHGSINGWHARTGDYATTAELLPKADAKRPEQDRDVSEAVQAVLSRARQKSGTG